VLDAPAAADLLKREYETLNVDLDADRDSWKSSLPGKPLLGILAGRFKLDTARAKTAYLSSADLTELGPFAEVLAIFRHFATLGMADDEMTADPEIETK
jgi:hypothetical protein